MSVELDVAADLTFEVAVGEGGDARTVHGSLKGSGRALVLEVDDPSAFAGRGDAPMIRTLADTLAGRGIRIEVCSGDTHLITLGATRSPWWQRRVTGSRHIRLGSLRGVWTSARSRARTTDRPVLPDSTLAPPATVLPLAPTFMRRPRRPVGTTHAPSGTVGLLSTGARSAISRLMSATAASVAASLRRPSSSFSSVSKTWPK